MKKLKLCQVHPGEQFTLDGVEFVKLDDDNDVAFVVTEDVVLRRVPFSLKGKGGRNDFAWSRIESSLLKWLGEHPGIEEAVVERPIDLTSMDGMTDYGCPVVRARILTIDEYRRHRRYIPLTSEPYWLATPWATESSPYSSPDRACSVYTDGTLYYNRVYNPNFAARPALYLEYDVVVSVEDEEEEDRLARYTM